MQDLLQQVVLGLNHLVTPFLLSYLLYLASGIVLLTVVAAIYMRVTPYNELALIRAGHSAAALSFAGAMIGFALTLAACAIYHARFVGFVGWAFAAMIVQLFGYVMTTLLIPNLKQEMLDNNVAVGGFVGVIGLVLGILNAGCLS
jgi:putative membrane protein